MNSKIIYDLLKEIREEQKEHSKQLVNQSETMIKMNLFISKNTEDLATHMKRTKLLEDLYNKHDQRIIKLEEPSKVKEWLWNKWSRYFVIITVICTVVVAVFKIIKYFH